MSRLGVKLAAVAEGFPRSRGDEPLYLHRAII